ncbi:hypothetical protein EJF36_07845 [Bacillus sp. HMF5848]|uniref:DUF6884 domain-containing protein n=1 Tax=Bacillus sp. HMF5848 TaxID=2495421 RepID=UPI000F790E59|nr:DUF6884 domain-containing protein [Bacillus sp. HMF5848]RSK26781.1 hypothetical protein EJF36_07845 [Bacillus sp. HMF5848]
MKKLCIIPCGRKKIWDIDPTIEATKAHKAYVGTFHSYCQAYARLFFDDNWVVLSAKHGFLLKDDIVPGSYDVSFSMKNHPEVITNDQLRKQIIEKNLNDYDHYVVLAGKKYRRIVEGLFPRGDISYPLAQYKGLGYMLRALRLAIDEKKELVDSKC